MLQYNPTCVCNSVPIPYLWFQIISEVLPTSTDCLDRLDYFQIHVHVVIYPMAMAQTIFIKY